MTLIKFKKEDKYRLRGTPSVHLTDKTLVFNATAMRSYFGDKSYADLFFEDEERKIYLRPRQTCTADSIEIKKYREKVSPMGIVSAAPFFRQFNIRAKIEKKGSRTLPLKEDQKKKMLFIDLA